MFGKPLCFAVLAVHLLVSGTDGADTPLRKLGNGAVAFSGRGTMNDPYNMPHGNNRILTSSLEKRELHQETLKRELSVLKNAPLLQDAREAGERRRLAKMEKLQRSLRVLKGDNMTNSTDSGNSTDTYGDHYNGTLIDYGNGTYGTDNYGGTGDGHDYGDIDEYEEDNLPKILDRCYQFDTSDMSVFGNSTKLHPCFAEQCKVKKSGKKCLDLIYDFCCNEDMDMCNPSAEMLELRNQTSCSMSTCSYFMEYDHGNSFEEPSYDPNVCMFSDKKVCSDCMASWNELQNSYHYNSCEWDEMCLKNRVHQYVPEVAELIALAGNPFVVTKGGRRLQYQSYSQKPRWLSIPKARVLARPFSNRKLTSPSYLQPRRRLTEPGGGDGGPNVDKMSCSLDALRTTVDKMTPVLECLEFDEMNRTNCESLVRCNQTITDALGGFESHTAEMECFLLAAVKGYDWVQQVWSTSDIPPKWMISKFQHLVESFHKCHHCTNEKISYMITDVADNLFSCLGTVNSGDHVVFTCDMFGENTCFEQQMEKVHQEDRMCLKYAATERNYTWIKENTNSTMDEWQFGMINSLVMAMHNCFDTASNSTCSPEVLDYVYTEMKAEIHACMPNFDATTDLNNTQYECSALLNCSKHMYTPVGRKDAVGCVFESAFEASYEWVRDRLTNTTLEEWEYNGVVHFLRTMEECDDLDKEGGDDDGTCDSKVLDHLFSETKDKLFDCYGIVSEASKVDYCGPGFMCVMDLEKTLSEKESECLYTTVTKDGYDYIIEHTTNELKYWEFEFILEFFNSLDHCEGNDDDGDPSCSDDTIMFLFEEVKYELLKCYGEDLDENTDYHNGNYTCEFFEPCLKDLDGKLHEEDGKCLYSAFDMGYEGVSALVPDLELWEFAALENMVYTMRGCGGGDSNCSKSSLIEVFGDNGKKLELFSCLGMHDSRSKLDLSCSELSPCIQPFWDDMEYMECWMEGVYRQNYDWVVNMTNSSLQQWEYNVFAALANKMGECGSADDNHGDDHGDDHGDKHEPLECPPDMVYELYDSFFNRHNLTDCFGETSHHVAQADCGKTMQCYPIVYNASYPHLYPDANGRSDQLNPTINPYIACAVRINNGMLSFDDIDQDWPSNAQFDFSIDLYEYVVSIVDQFMTCMGGGDGKQQDWDATATCQTKKEGRRDRCNAGCCAFHEQWFEQLNSNLTGPMSVCTPLLEYMRYDKYNTDSGRTLEACFRQQCGGCYGENAGPYGQPEDYRERRKYQTNPYEEVCVESIYDHCSSNPQEEICIEKCPFDKCDTRDNENCPCEMDSCQTFYNASFLEAGYCRDFRDQVLKEYLAQGFHQPEEDGMRSFLEQMGKDLAKPVGNFTLPDKLREFGVEQGCVFIDEIVQCVGHSVDFCNTREGSWNQACRMELSECGDGHLSWGEQCDDGNKNFYQDGCQCDYVQHNYYCPKPGLQCEVCVRNENMDGGYDNKKRDDSQCNFCLNDRRIGYTSPCYRTECQAVTNYTTAKQCDDIVTEFCNALKEKGLHDPGCKDYVPKTKFYSIPAVPKCTFQIREINVAGQNMKKVKFGIIECPLVDPTFEGRDTTPWVPYWTPLHALSDDDLSNLKGENKTVLEILAVKDEGELVPLTTLTDHQLNPYDDVKLHRDGQPIVDKWQNPYLNRVARLQTYKREKEEWEKDMHYEENCDHPQGEREMLLLPPCDDPMATVARFGMKEMKFRGLLQNDWTFKDFKDMDLEHLDKFMCTPKRGSLQFMMILSTTRMEWQGNMEVEKEQHELDCSRYYHENQGNHHLDWESMKEQCDSLEGLLQSGNATVKFGSRLYQTGCLDTKCKQVIAKCAAIPIEKHVSKAVDLELFKNKSALLPETIGELANVQNWATVKRILVEVSALAQSAPIAAAMDIFHSVTVKGNMTKILKGVSDYCPHDYGFWNYSTSTWELNPDWTADPCCNWERRQYECCRIQDVEGAIIQTVKSFDEPKMSSCKNPARITQTFKNLFQTLKTSREVAERLATKADPKQFDKVWEFVDDCRSKINNEDNKELNSQADCYCPYSTFIQDQKRCEVDYADEPKCFAHCFRTKYSTENKYILQFLKEEWGISEWIHDNQKDEDERFADTWAVKMTEEGCVGERAWEHDIGYSGYHWSCDDECRANHTCSGYNALELIVDKYNKAKAPEDDWIDSWSLSNNDTKCSEFGGNRTCRYPNHDGSECYGWQCELPEMKNMSIPCDKMEKCNKECNAPCQSQDVCEAKNGTWMPQMNSCCPKEGYIRKYPGGGGAYCSSVPPTKPNRDEIRDEICCKAAEGNWNPQEHHGCCFGEWVHRKYDEWEWMECREHIDTWEVCHECHKNICEPMRHECEQCHRDNEACCGAKYVSQNKTACLSYTECNDRDKKWNNEVCEGDKFCSTRWGYPESVPATCRVHLDQSSCTAAGYTYGSPVSQWRYHQFCYKPIPANGAIQDCFDPALCPVKTFAEKFPGWEEPAGGYFDSEDCYEGCYLPKSNHTINNYTWGSYCTITINSSQWSAMVLGDNCVLRKWMLSNLLRHEGTEGTKTPAERCTELGGASVDNSFTFSSSKYNDKASCESGNCEGTVNRWKMHPTTHMWHSAPQPYNESQCIDLSDRMCDQWCPMCRSSKSNTNVNGGCFDQSEVLLEDTSELECLNNTNHTWHTCPEPDVNSRIEWTQLQSFCTNFTAHNVSQSVMNSLQCHATYDRCPTVEKCEARGECHSRYGWLNLETQKCNDPGWSHGDRWDAWTTVTTNNGKEDVTTQEWVSCSSRENIDGVCVSARPVDGCGEDWHLWHAFGCRVEGLYAQGTCEGAGHTWYIPLRTKAACESIKACKLNRWDVRHFGTEECASCGGEVVNFAQWHGGNWQTAYSRKFEWHENGREEASVNSWTGKQATWKIREQLEKPVMKSYAQYKMQELFQVYKAYKGVLQAVACDCGGGTGDCFEGLDVPTVDASQNLLDGDEATQVGEGVFITTGNQSRRLRRLTESSTSTGTSATVTAYTSGIYDKHEPCSSGADKDTIDALVVVNDANVVVGQLLGDGKGIDVLSTELVDGKVVVVPFKEATICMDARLDMNVRETQFPVFGAAKKQTDGRITPLIFADDALAYEERTASKVCVNVAEPGVYYPIARVKDSLVTANTACSGGCGSGTCALDDTTGAASCICKCGFSGATCNSGCGNYCSGKGTCAAETNTCTCTAGATAPLYTGSTCEKMNCPTDSAGNTCSAQGLCKIVENDATCECSGGYRGASCSEVIPIDTSTGDDKGFGEEDEIEEREVVITLTLPPTSPTMPPSPTTPPPTMAPREPVLTLEVEVSNDILEDENGTAANVTDILKNLEAAMEELLPEDQKDDIEVKVQVNVKKTGEVALSGDAIGEAELELVEDAIEDAQCTGLSAANCNVKTWLKNGTRRMLSTTTSVGYEVNRTVTAEENNIAEEITAESLTTAVATKAQEQNITVDLTVTSTPEAVTETEMVITAVVKESAMTTQDDIDEGVSKDIDISNVQTSFSNTTTLADTIQTSTNVTVNVTTIEIDLCEGRECSGNGQCVVSNGTSSCECNTGYSGVQCEGLPPTPKPTLTPTAYPSKAPSAKPSVSPTSEPSESPSVAPSSQPSKIPTSKAPTTSEPTSTKLSVGAGSSVEVSTFTIILALGFRLFMRYV